MVPLDLLSFRSTRTNMATQPKTGRLSFYLLFVITLQLIISDCFGQGEDHETVRCPELNGIQNGKILQETDGLENNYGSIVEYTCDVSFVLKGNRYRTCGQDGRWSGETPECVEYCPDYEERLHSGMIFYEHDRRLVGTTAYFRCNSDSDLFPPQPTYATCLPSQKWSMAKLPKCLKRAEIDFKRNTKYFLMQNKMMIKNLKRSDSPFKHGTKIGVKCRRGYELHWRSYVNTLYFVSTNINGTWDPYMPYCTRARCNIMGIHNNVHTMVWYENGTKVEEAFIEHNVKVHENCSEGYEISTRRNRTLQTFSATCSKGSIALKTCKPKSCSAMSLPQEHTEYGSFGEFSNDFYSHREKIIVSCNPNTDYELVDEETGKFLKEVQITCYFGQWKPANIPVCIEKHCELKVTEGIEIRDEGSVDGRVYTGNVNISSGTAVVTDCRTGYEMFFGPKNVERKQVKNVCFKGVWSVNVICKPKPCKLPKISFGKYINRDGHSESEMHGSKVHFECNTGYDMILEMKVINSFSSECEFGDWNKRVFPECKPRSCELSKQNGTLYTINNIPVEEAIKVAHGTKVEVECYNNYELIDEDGYIYEFDYRKTTCHFGEWQNKLFCRKKNFETERPVIDEETIRTTTNTPFNQQGCWTPNDISISPQLEDGTEVDPNVWLEEGTVLHISCLMDYDFLNDTILCRRDGTWNLTDDFCPELEFASSFDCPPLSNGEVNELDSSHYKLQCYEGYTLNLPFCETTSCSENSFTCGDAMCTPGDCEVPEKHGQIIRFYSGSLSLSSRSTVKHGDNITLQCNEGFVPTAERLTCFAGKFVPGLTNGQFNSCEEARCDVCEFGICIAHGQCKCMEGYTGEHCNNAICQEECTGNGGYCSKPYMCICPEGKEGIDCSKNPSTEHSENGRLPIDEDKISFSTTTSNNFNNRGCWTPRSNSISLQLEDGIKVDPSVWVVEGTVLHISCFLDNDFQDDIIICRRDGTWNITDEVCLESDHAEKEQPVIDKEIISSSTSMNTPVDGRGCWTPTDTSISPQLEDGTELDPGVWVEEGTVLHISCFLDYDFLNDTILCSWDGTWNLTDAFCSKLDFQFSFDCPSLLNGKVNKLDNGQNKLQCHEGFTLNLPFCETTRCSENSFTCGEAMCRPDDCELPEKHDQIMSFYNGSLSLSSRSTVIHGASITLHCMEGYVPTAERLTCSAGKFVPMSTNGRFHRCEKARCDVCEFGTCIAHGQCKCMEGYTGEHCNNAICYEECTENGGYCSNPYTCICPKGKEGTDCSELMCAMPKTNALFNPQQDWYSLNSELTGVCDDRHSLTGSPSITCQKSGLWSGHFLCEPSSDPVMYRFDIYTGNMWRAGTDANVEITIIGEGGSLIFKLEKDIEYHWREGKLFERSMRDRFLMNSYTSTGKVTDIILRHDGAGSFSDWFVTKVTLYVNQTEEFYDFKVGQWIYPDTPLTFKSKSSCKFDVKYGYPGAGYNMGPFVRTTQLWDCNVVCMFFGRCLCTPK